MSDLQVIETVLERAARRRRWQNAWRGLWQGALIGVVVWLLALLAFKAFPLPESILLRAGLLAAAMALGGFALRWRPVTVTETARWLDVREHLQERLSTALEVAATPTDAGWKDLLLRDAARRAEGLDARQLLPFHLPAASRWVLLVLVLALGVGFVPEYRSAKHVQQKREMENIRDTGRQLAELTKRRLETRPPALPTTQKAMETVSELGERLQGKQMTRSEALRDLTSVTDKLKEQVRDLSKDPAIRRMEQAARAPGGGETAQSPEELQKQLEQLEKALGNQAGNPDAIDKLRKDLQKLKAMAGGLANNASGGKDGAKEELSKALNDLAKKAAETGLSLPSLDAAIQALEQSKIDQFVKDMEFVELDLEKMQAMAKALKDLQLKLDKLGKDLAERLEKGQGMAALASLQKLIRELRSSDLTPEQQRKILEEVSKAINPAAPYGKVAEHLQKADQQLRQGDREAGRQALVDAAKELERLIGQCGDCDSLMATLQALQMAQMCVGSCQSWGQCLGPPRAGQGKGGRGVGTWAEEFGWQFEPQITDLWDNSGINRPDQDPRGVSDRGDAKLADNLAPTKIKGQFAPGGQMPSITLKGVSIKGESKVAYEEAVTTAQSEAQSALSQEKVPRAYQGAVREYFDDLKK